MNHAFLILLVCFTCPSFAQPGGPGGPPGDDDPPVGGEPPGGENPVGVPLDDSVFVVFGIGLFLYFMQHKRRVFYNEK